MHAIGNALKLGLGVAASAGALVVASQLGATGHAEAAVASRTVAIVIAGSLMHIPAAFLMSALHMAADGMEDRLSAIVHADRPVANEDVQRAGRRAALRGVKVAVNRYIKSAKADVLDHDLVQARQFSRAARKWVAEEIRATRRKDRPSSGGWTRMGLGFEGVVRCEAPAAAVARIENDAWTEFATAMARRNIRVPGRFRSYFAGAENCGLGWRRAGHLIFMRELKDNRDALVGFMVDALLARQEAPRRRRAQPDPAAEREGAAAGRPLTGGRSRPPLKLKRPKRSAPKAKAPRSGNDHTV